MFQPNRFLAHHCRHFASNIRRPHPRAAVQGFAPQQVLAARGWDGKPIAVAPVKLGFISLGGTILASDISGMFAKFGLPQPKITVVGTPQSSDPNGANGENTLDFWSALIWSAATGLAADITIAYENNDANGIQQGIADLQAAGVRMASLSWGSPEDSRATAYRPAIQAFQANGGWLFVASGDNSEDDGTGSPTPDSPCDVPEAIGVGGVSLTQGSLNGAWFQKAWGDGRANDEGGGGGVSRVFSMPSYQNGIVAGTMRGVPDISDLADPNTGFALLLNGHWTVIGGTSGAAPTAMGLWAIARGVANLKGVPIPNDLHPLLYQNQATVCQDVTSGSNGYPATVGYDFATGLGTTILPAAIAALCGTAASLPVNPPPVNPPPPISPPPAPPTPLPTPSQVIAVIDHAFAALESSVNWMYAPILLPALRYANQVIDQAVKQYLSAPHMRSRFASLPAVYGQLIISAVDGAFAGVEKELGLVWTPLLEIARQQIDAELASLLGLSTAA